MLHKASRPIVDLMQESLMSPETLYKQEQEAYCTPENNPSATADDIQLRAALWILTLSLIVKYHHTKLGQALYFKSNPLTMHSEMLW